MNILQVKSISKSYRSHLALDNVSFDIAQGSVLGLLGPNGAGKTTLIRIINQIILADQGQILFKDKPMTPADVRSIGYLPEERGLYKKMKVGDHLLYLVRLRGLSKKEAVEKINVWLDKMDMRSWVNKKVEDLSKGMQQRVQFVATVAHEPELLILDEPFSGFDPVHADLIKEQLLLLKEKGTTIVYSTHRMDAVEELCEHITMINQSKVVLDGAKLDIKDSYRQGKYDLEYLSDQPIASIAAFEVLEDDVFGQHRKASLKLHEGYTTKDVFSSFGQIEVRSFVEKVPSIHEIFVEQVNGETNG